MRLYSGNFGLIAHDIIKGLRQAELADIPDENVDEAELDVVGVLKEYSRMDRTLTNRARDMVAAEGSQNEHRVKRQLAREKNFPLGDDALDYIVNQMIETFEHSQYVEEIFGETRELRALINPIIKKHTRDRSGELDEAVRKQLKNLEEGSAAWDIEYERTISRFRKDNQSHLKKLFLEILRLCAEAGLVKLGNVSCLLSADVKLVRKAFNVLYVCKVIYRARHHFIRSSFGPFTSAEYFTLQIQLKRLLTFKSAANLTHQSLFFGLTSSSTLLHTHATAGQRRGNVTTAGSAQTEVNQCVHTLSTRIAVALQ
jgi:hypothetical protein